MNKAILYLSFLFCFISFSQDNWVSIDCHDLQFKLPNGYNFNETTKAKIYSFQDDEKIISLSIFKNDAVKNLKTDDLDGLKKYYKGVIDGYLDKSGSKLVSSEAYKIQNNLAAKNLLKVVYQDGTPNLLDTHVIYIDGLTYFATFQLGTNPDQQTIEAKDFFFDSFTINASKGVTEENGSATAISVGTYQLGEIIGKVILYLVLALVVIIALHFAFKNRKRTV